MSAVALILATLALIVSVVGWVKSRANLREADRVLKLAADQAVNARAAANEAARWQS